MGFWNDGGGALDQKKTPFLLFARGKGVSGSYVYFPDEPLILVNNLFMALGGVETRLIKFFIKMDRMPP